MTEPALVELHVVNGLTAERGWTLRGMFVCPDGTGSAFMFRCPGGREASPRVVAGAFRELADAIERSIPKKKTKRKR